MDPLTISSLDPSGCGLQLRFSWLGDRYGHVIERISVPESGSGSELHSLPLLASIESAPDESWPSSPPLQQLSVEPIQATSVALAVGAAGQAHWSLSVTPITGGAGQPGFLFDAAIRCANPIGSLGSDYLRLGAEEVSGEHDLGPSVELSIEPLEEVAATTVSNLAHIVQIAPVVRQAPTVRWAYRILAKSR